MKDKQRAYLIAGVGFLAILLILVATGIINVPGAVTAESQCLKSGNYWYDGACHTTPKPAGGAGGVAVEGACGASSTYYGDSSTVKINAYDYGTTPRTTITDANVSVLVNGILFKTYDVYSVTDSTGLSVSVGDEVAVVAMPTVPIDYYGNALVDQDGSVHTFTLANADLVCVDTRAETYTFKAYDIIAQSSMAVAMYDKNMNVLASGNNSSQEDFKMDMGADDTEYVYFELTNSGADDMYDFKTVCTGYQNEVDDVKLLEIQKGGKVYTDFEKTTPAKNVSDATIESTVAATAAQYKTCWSYAEGVDSALRLTESESLLLKFEVKSDPTSAPGTDDTATGDIFYIMAFDGAYKLNQAGDQAEFGWFDSSTSEDPSKLGVAETMTSPLGKQVGAVVEVY